MTASIVADVKLETSGVRSGVASIKGQMRGLASSTGSVFKGVLGANLVGAGVEAVKSGLDAVISKVGEVRDAGSNLQQSTGAVDAVFGKYSSNIKKQAAAAAQSLGLSKNEYQELTTTLGAGLKNQGIKDFAQQTSNVTKLGADLSAQFGGSTKDAVQAIGSLMRGEADPIERYGVSIKESAIAAELAAKGQSKLKGKALEQAKSQARLGLLFKQTKDAQGAFAREGDSLANVQQRNAAAAENLKAKLGTALLPIFTAGANTISTKVLPILDKVVTWAAANLPGALAAAKAAVQPVFDVLGGLAGQIAGFVKGGGLQQFAGQLAPIAAGIMSVFSGVGAVIRAVAPVVVQVVGTIINTVRANLPVLAGVYQNIASILQSVASIVTSVWQQIGPIVLPIIQNVFGTIIAIIGGAFNIVAGLFKTIAAVLRGDWSGAWNGIKQIASGGVQIVLALFNNIANQVRMYLGRVQDAVSGLRGKLPAIWAAIRIAATSAWQAVVTAIASRVAAMVSAVVGRVNQVKSFVSSAWSTIKSATSSAWQAVVNAITSKVSAAVNVVRSLPGKAKSALGNLGSALHSAGANLIQGFINGISGSIGAVINKARELAGAAIRAAKAALGEHSPSTVFRQIGRYVGVGFYQGIQGTEAQVKGAVKKLSTAAANAYRKHAISAAKYRAVMQTVQRQDDALLKNARQRTAVTKGLAAAQARLNDLIKARADYQANVTSSARSYAAITSIEAPENTGQTSANLIQGLKDRLNALQNFRLKLAQLAKLGLNKSTYDQLVAAGVEGGMDEVQALLSGGQGAISQVNSIQGKLNTETTLLGQQTAGQMYAAGIKAQQGLIKGLAAQSKQLNAAATALARALVAAVKKALKIKSPSRVFLGIGEQVTRGLVIGLDDRTTVRAAQRLASGLQSGFGMPQLAAVSAGGGATVIQITVNPTPLATPAEVGYAVVKAIKSYQTVSGRQVLSA